VYFKENGNGMVSSPSFRGTTAQQTAVIWNGININSQLNGQTDFNTLTSRDFNSIVVRSGGGSVIYGSGAIGGTIHLNNEFSFKDKFENQLRLDFGSFSTYSANYTLTLAYKSLK
jgi:iron complex outermembrane receptor protein